jgi:hypothetical protein
MCCNNFVTIAVPRSLILSERACMARLRQVHILLDVPRTWLAKAKNSVSLCHCQQGGFHTRYPVKGCGQARLILRHCECYEPGLGLPQPAPPNIVCTFCSSVLVLTTSRPPQPLPDYPFAGASPSHPQQSNSYSISQPLQHELPKILRWVYHGSPEGKYNPQRRRTLL